MIWGEGSEERGGKICHDVCCLPLYPEGLKVRSSCRGLFNKHNKLWFACMDHLSSDLGLPVEAWKDSPLQHCVSFFLCSFFLSQFCNEFI